MDQFFSHLTVTDIHHDLIRNIVSLSEAENPFDDLTSNTEEWLLARHVESDSRPRPYQSHTPEIDRPFEDDLWFRAITWPFNNRQTSRFSDGSFAVWYGSDTLKTSVYESAYHWFRGLLCDAGFEQEEVVIDLKLYSVACNTLWLDFRLIADNYPYLLHKTDYCSKIFRFRMSGEYPQAIVGLFLSSSTDGGNWSVSPGWSLPEYFPPKVE